MESCLLPVDMKPNKKAFEALGFVFKKIRNDDVLYRASLPEGWALKVDASGYSTSIIDDKGRRRGYFFINETASGRSGKMSLCRRYHLHHEYETKDKNGPVIIMVKDADGSIASVIGRCKSQISFEYDRLKAEVVEYMKVNYPDWEDATAYWDLP